MKHLILLILIFLPNFFQFGFASENDTIKTSNSILYEKVYLHIDRELYAPGDDICFKSYLVSGINNKLVLGYKNIYVQFISEKGVMIINRLILSRDGTEHVVSCFC